MLRKNRREMKSRHAWPWGFLAALFVIAASVQIARAQGGTLDPSFGSSGLFSGGSEDPNNNTAGVIDSSGRIVIAGSVAIGSVWDFALVRLNPDGTLDSRFGTSGKVTTGFSGFSAFAQAIAIDSQGRIVVAGYVNNSTTPDNFALARYNSDGTLDSTFGSGGTVVVDISGSNNLNAAFAVAIDSLDRIVAAGTASNGTVRDFALARFNTNGSLDTTFNSTGIVTTDVGGTLDSANALAIDDTGRIVAAGVVGISFGNSGALVRYNSDGSLDTTFNSTGKGTNNFGGVANVYAVAIDGSGKIIIAGDKNGNDFALARYQTDGSLDTTFNSTGNVITDFGGIESGRGVAIDSLGHVIAAGWTEDPTQPFPFHFALARYNSDGSLDSTFGVGGKVTSIFSSTDKYLAYSALLDGVERIVAVGKNQAIGQFAAARYLSANADLILMKSASPDPALIGSPLTYTINVTNNGPDATLALVTDALPAGVTFVSSSTTQGSCSEAAGTVTCPLGNLDLSASATVTIDVQTTAQSGSSVTNTAMVAGNDPNVADNSATVSTNVVPAADLSVTKTGSPNPVSGGSNITYTIVVANNGPSTATQVVLSDLLTDSLISFSSTAGASCSISKSKGKSMLACQIPTLSSGSSETVTLVVKSPHKKGTTSNTASVTANEADPDTSNNTATAAVTIQ